MPHHDDPATVLRRMVQMFNTGDGADVHDVVAVDYIDHQGFAGIPLRGRQAFLDVVERARADFSDVDVQVESLVVIEANLVAARLRWHGTRPDGATLHRETIEMIHVEAGLAVEHWGTTPWTPTPKAADH